MKKLLLLSIFILGAFVAEAQVITAAPSPKCKIEQTVGLTNVTVEYSRPSVKDRVIFGNVVPYGAMWRTGANKNTVITFSNDVTIDGNKLQKGSYAIYVKPSEKNWEFNFYTDTNNWGTNGMPDNWDPAKVALTITSPVKAMPMSVESFTIDIGSLRSESATISFMWDSVRVELELTLETNKMIEASIKKTMAGPTWKDNYKAGRYYLENTDATDQALKYLTLATEAEGGEKFWVLRFLGLAQAKSGMMEEAKASLAKSTKLAKIAKNPAYQRLNAESLAAWKKMK